MSIRSRVSDVTTDVATVPFPQTVLFLQSHPSTFARRLADALETAGCRVLRVNFCFGDWLYWFGRRSINYRGRFADWERFLVDLIKREAVTDILYYGDCKPYHLVAGDVARSLGVRALAYEFGYLRPDWITLEQYGMSTRSHFPVEPETIRRIGAKFGPADLAPRYPYTAAHELTHEIFYNLATYFMTPLFWNYYSDRYYNPIVEYLTGLPKQFRAAQSTLQAEQTIDDLLAIDAPFFLYSLQLQSDYQLRHHAAFPHQRDAIEAVIRSFAQNAASDAHLVFKCHPLDNDGEGWPNHIRRAADAKNVGDRVHYIDGGRLDRMLARARGCIMINSTVGMHAIALGCPTKVLGGAVFDIAGLTHQGPLDTFWEGASKPDAELADALVKALAGTIQIKGNFFSKEGQAAAIPKFVDRIINGSVNGAGAFIDPPPRLTDRHRMKI